MFKLLPIFILFVLFQLPLVCLANNEALKEKAQESLLAAENLAHENSSLESLRQASRLYTIAFETYEELAKPSEPTSQLNHEELIRLMAVISFELGKTHYYLARYFPMGSKERGVALNSTLCHLKKYGDLTRSVHGFILPEDESFIQKVKAETLETLALENQQSAPAIVPPSEGFVDFEQVRRIVSH